MEDYIITREDKDQLLKHLLDVEEWIGQSLRKEPRCPKNPDLCPINQYLPEGIIVFDIEDPASYWIDDDNEIGFKKYNGLIYPYEKVEWWQELSLKNKLEIFNWLVDVMKGG